jgi:putative membrane protein
MWLLLEFGHFNCKICVIHARARGAGAFSAQAFPLLSSSGFREVVRRTLHREGKKSTSLSSQDGTRCLRIMIVRPKTTRIRMLFAWHGASINLIAKPLAVIFCLAVLAVWGHHRFDNFILRLSPAPLSLMGVALAIFVGFRNNTCYERYCEARKLWGALMNRSRDIARFATTVPGLPATDPEVRDVVNLTAAYAYALQHHLRGNDPGVELVRLLGKPRAHAADHCDNVPQHILQLLQERFVAWHRAGRYGEVTLEACLAKLAALSDVLGGCERIRSTPIPYAYDVLLHRTTYVYCALLPFGLASIIGWTTPPITLFIAYSFMALDSIAGELEDPFGEDANDLPLAALAVNIERAVGQTVGATDLPPRLRPDRYHQLR